MEHQGEKKFGIARGPPETTGPEYFDHFRFLEVRFLEGGIGPRVALEAFLQVKEEWGYIEFTLYNAG